MEHEDGRFVSWPAPEGVAELIVLMVNIADLHTQCPPPVPRVKKGKTQAACSGYVALGGAQVLSRDPTWWQYDSKPYLPALVLYFPLKEH